MRRFQLRGGGRNGEAIYIGTRSTHLRQFGAADGAVDRSDGNWIHHNAFNSRMFESLRGAKERAVEALPDVARYGLAAGN